MFFSFPDTTSSVSQLPGQEARPLGAQPRETLSGSQTSDNKNNNKTTYHLFDIFILVHNDFRTHSWVFIVSSFCQRRKQQKHKSKQTPTCSNSRWFHIRFVRACCVCLKAFQTQHIMVSQLPGQEAGPQGPSPEKPNIRNKQKDTLCIAMWLFLTFCIFSWLQKTQKPRKERITTHAINHNGMWLGWLVSFFVFLCFHWQFP